ncbi:hypothetical protein [Chryseobacterium turcicum]|uniref:Uncharacterized protein n=1 Tax=Chryseobacterium turcicum TaxID=2898076 RepID=A0A9Q3UYW4_9FLAO|nr:hypothetical protein [Chryseobacterium turcicum]MCD1115267.1 hypothetical protein [Chryseobacterium turcicum]
MSIITDYKVTFGIKKIHDSNLKFMRSISYSLDSIIVNFRNAIDCDNLLEAINRRLGISQQGEIIYPTQSLQIITISYTLTKIYHDMEAYDLNPNITPDYSLPTADFKEIVKAWRNFVVNDSGLLT